MNSIYEVRILIVDDNTDLLHLLYEQLSGAGYRQIQTAQSCVEAKNVCCRKTRADNSGYQSS